MRRYFLLLIFMIIILMAPLAYVNTKYGGMVVFDPVRFANQYFDLTKEVINLFLSFALLYWFWDYWQKKRSEETICRNLYSSLSLMEKMAKEASKCIDRGPAGGSPEAADNHDNEVKWHIKQLGVFQEAVLLQFVDIGDDKEGRLSQVVNNYYSKAAPLLARIANYQSYPTRVQIYQWLEELQKVLIELVTMLGKNPDKN